MKLFTILFSLYILSLSSLPCSDEIDCIEQNTEKNNTSQHTDHEEDTENCSPFCICACCGTNISSIFNFPNFIEEKQPLLTSQKSKIVYSNDPLVSNFFGNIWQPPQI